MSVKHYSYLPNSYCMRTLGFAVCNYILSIILRPCKLNLFRSWLYWLIEWMIKLILLLWPDVTVRMFPRWEDAGVLRSHSHHKTWSSQTSVSNLCYFLFVHWKLPSPQTTLGCSCFRRLWVRRTGPSDGTGITSGFMFNGWNQQEDDTAAKRDAFLSLTLCALV